MAESLARRLRVILGAEAAAYAGLGAWLCVERGWTFAAAVAVVALIALGWRAAFIAGTYAIAWRHGSAAPPGLERGVLELLLHALKELGAWTLVYAGPQAFVRRFMGDGRPPGGTGARLPVLLVPGYVSNRGMWWAFGRALAARGETVWPVTLEPVYASIDSLADAVAERIEEFRTAARTPQVVLVAHSMGGLVARAYLRDHGAAAVARLITIGTPHHGSVLAVLGAGQNAREMEPGSAWLAALARSEARGLPVPCTAISSVHDNLVAPQTSGMHPAARNLPLAGVGHVSLGFSRAVLEMVAADLDAANAAAGVRSAAPRAAAASGAGVHSRP
jgi:pimeloyl-ACP methyl ester carboxylesterase